MWINQQVGNKTGKVRKDEEHKRKNQKKIQSTRLQTHTSAKARAMSHAIELTGNVRVTEKLDIQFHGQV